MIAVSAALMLLSTATSGYASGPQGVIAPAITLSQEEQAKLQASTTVSAATRATLARGAAILDAGNGPLGRVIAVDNAFVTVATAKSVVRFPLNAFTNVGASPKLNATAAQIDLIADAQRMKDALQTTVANPR